nr:hypothetical protein [Nitrosomonas nitrosa]
MTDSPRSTINPDDAIAARSPAASGPSPFANRTTSATTGPKTTGRKRETEAAGFRCAAARLPGVEARSIPPPARRELDTPRVPRQ